MSESYYNQADEIVKGLKPIIDHIEGKVGFTNKLLYLQAFTHSSFANEHPDTEDNEVLEFLGDEILDASVTRILADRFSGESTGEYPWLVSDFDEEGYTDLKKKLVDGENLTRVANYWELGKYLRLGKGAENLRTTPSILENAVEALIAAIAINTSYYDSDAGGYYKPSNEHKWLPNMKAIDYGMVDEAVSKLLQIDDFLNKVENKNNVEKGSIIQEGDLENPKGGLNKLYTKGKIEKPEYEVISQWVDDDHRTLWKCKCHVNGFHDHECDGYFYKKSDAESNAALKVLNEILQLNPGL